MEIVAAIERAPALLLLLTAHANQSRQVGREVACADARSVPLVPIRLEEVPLSGRLEFYVGDAQWIDALARPLEGILAGVVDRIQSRLRQGAVRTEAEPVVWAPPRERVLAELAADLTRYRDLAFRMQAAMSDSARVVARRPEANRIFIEAIESYNEFGRAFIHRLSRHGVAVRKYWGGNLADAFDTLHAFIEGEVYRGRMFELNDVRVRLNDLAFQPERPDGAFAEADRLNRLPLQRAREALATLSRRIDELLARLAAAP